MTTKPKSTKPKLEAATTAPLHVSTSLPEKSVEALLTKLFELAMEGNTAAAKLYMDHASGIKPEASQLSPEEALKIIQQHLKKAS